MPGKLRLGVIGAGSWAVRAHLPILASRPEVQFVGVCRKGLEALDRVRNEFGFSVASEDYRDVLDAEPDIVVVASPPALHREHVEASLTAGAHVLCEKPMTIDPADAWELAELAQQVNRQLLISFGWNYTPMVRATKALLLAQGIGTLEHLTLHMSSSTRELLCNTGSYAAASPEYVPEAPTWTDPTLSGGGYGQAQLSHALGLTFHLIPDRVSEAFAFMASTPDARVELHDAITVRFDGGGVGTISGGSLHSVADDRKHHLDLRAIGSEGQLAVDLHRELAIVYRADSGRHDVQLQTGAGAYDPGGPAHALVDVALGNAANDCAPAELGARTVETLALAYRSARSGRLERRDDALAT